MAAGLPVEWLISDGIILPRAIYPLRRPTAHTLPKVQTRNLGVGEDWKRAMGWPGPQRTPYPARVPDSPSLSPLSSDPKPAASYSVTDDSVTDGSITDCTEPSIYIPHILGQYQYSESDDDTNQESLDDDFVGGGVDLRMIDDFINGGVDDHIIDDSLELIDKILDQLHCEEARYQMVGELVEDEDYDEEEDQESRYAATLRWVSQAAAFHDSFQYLYPHLHTPNSPAYYPFMAQSSSTTSMDATYPTPPPAYYPPLPSSSVATSVDATDATTPPYIAPSPPAYYPFMARSVSASSMDDTSYTTHPQYAHHSTYLYSTEEEQPLYQELADIINRTLSYLSSSTTPTSTYSTSTDIWETAAAVVAATTTLETDTETATDLSEPCEFGTPDCLCSLQTWTWDAAVQEARADSRHDCCLGNDHCEFCNPYSVSPTTMLPPPPPVQAPSVPPETSLSWWLTEYYDELFSFEP